MKIEYKKEMNSTIQNLIPIERITDGNIMLNDGRRITILKVEPTNFKLKTLLEQKAILEGYKLFLKRCDFNMQILMQTQKRELEEYIKNIKEISHKKYELKEMLEDYINFLNEISWNKEIFFRSFYILVETTNLDERDIIFKISESLNACDNEVKVCSFSEIVKVFRNYLSKK